MVMEAKESHDMFSASWRTRKVNSIIQPEPEGPRTRSSKVQGQEKMTVPAQGESSALLHLLFRVGPPQIGGCLLTLVRVDLLSVS